MSLNNYSREELKDISMIELAQMILKEEKKAITYQEIYQKVIEYKEFNEVQQQEYLAQFYTDLNIDGRFLSIGSGQWGLRDWYPVEQIEEEISSAPKKKKKKKKAAKKPKKEKVYEDTEDDITEESLDFDQSDFSDDDVDFDGVGNDEAEEENYDEDYDAFDEETFDEDENEEEGEEDK
ncbi:DNA-directed RNA polymerase subunit delta [Paraliobacillus sp. PM-2]|uniref:DNA-directed RNA polymerase subunit delta n=1 Tax=Paraliobacillus sp. PM-2 TaxID=1462524 RepID=UPI00061CBDD7|nr:DNA-directed RNA polymerase subunit delta [Paraliobacillus sp. PM-2]CQR46140.1 DNA-directed RNA polymerase subunit delta [Paraliobacillus sp. PM-2]